MSLPSLGVLVSSSGCLVDEVHLFFSGLKVVCAVVILVCGLIWELSRVDDGSERMV